MTLDLVGVQDAKRDIDTVRRRIGRNRSLEKEAERSIRTWERRLDEFQDRRDLKNQRKRRPYITALLGLRAARNRLRRIRREREVLPAQLDAMRKGLRNSWVS